MSSGFTTGNEELISAYSFIYVFYTYLLGRGLDPQQSYHAKYKDDEQAR